jgi:hypothetical protein
MKRCPLEGQGETSEPIPAVKKVYTRRNKKAKKKEHVVSIPKQTFASSKHKNQSSYSESRGEYRKETANFYRMPHTRATNKLKLSFKSMTDPSLKSSIINLDESLENLAKKERSSENKTKCLLEKRQTKKI